VLHDLGETWVDVLLIEGPFTVDVVSSVPQMRLITITRLIRIDARS
jgi:hypothetical protein